MGTCNRVVALAALGFLGALGGPVGSAAAQSAPVVVIQPAQRVIAYAQGRFELHGDGTPTSPYYWVWFPTGSQAAPTPPASPVMIGGSARMVLGIDQRIFTYPEGRYELHGEGTPTSPFYWAWIPAGTPTVSLPPVPPFPPRS